MRDVKSKVRQQFMALAADPTKTGAGYSTAEEAIVKY
jgi:hypothetical protein